ncbi:MAG TPA: magnesium transporter [Ktedonobacteraceae bacterium]|nr:magnesium transporter [Ktedonobacteraceae bacterium]
MIFLSTLLRQSVYDSNNRRVGMHSDLYVELKETFPIVTALVIQTSLSGGRLIVSWPQVRSIEDTPVQLAVTQEHISTYTPDADELLLRRDILDKQIVDTQGFRVVKVNDLKLAQIKRTARLLGVDISFGGLLRRLSGQRAFDLLKRLAPAGLSERTVTWNYVEPIQKVSMTGQLALAGAGVGTSATATAATSGGIVPRVQLNVSQNKLAELHPADIADILEQLDVEDAGAMLERLDTMTAADTLNEVETPLRAELLNGLEPARAANLLERLAPDDAADILSDMPRHEVERLLSIMPIEKAQSIRILLRYGAETAGGIMTTEVVSLSQETTAEEALAYLRQHSSHLEMVYYLYIVDVERHLSGVVSMRQLVISAPGTRMQDVMDPDVIKVTVDTDQEEVARVIAKYDLLGVPVVDREEHLVGLVTVDDVIDVIHEEQAEDLSEIAGVDVEEPEEAETFALRTALSRFSWLAVSAIGGFVLALLISRVFGSLFALGTAFAQTSGLPAGLDARAAVGSVLCVVPMLLMTSGSAGSQALGIAGWRLRSQRGRDFWGGFSREVLLGTVGGMLTCLLTIILTWLLFHSLLLSVAMGLGFGLTLLVAYICGLILPNVLQRLHLRGSLISSPLLNPLIAVVSLCVFFAVTLQLIPRFLG